MAMANKIHGSNWRRIRDLGQKFHEKQKMENNYCRSRLDSMAFIAIRGRCIKAASSQKTKVQTGEAESKRERQLLVASGTKRTTTR